MFERVVVPLDGSEFAERSLPYAAALAEKFGARLVLVRAYDGPERAARMLATMPADPVGTIDPRTVEAVTQAAQEEAGEVKAYLDAQAQPLAARGLQVDTVMADDAAADTILREAHRAPGTLVVMSTHGRSGLGRLVFGSVAQEVLHNAHAPVLLIRIEGDVTMASGHDTSTDVSIGAPVMGSEGKLGEVHRVIISPNLHRVTNLVVRHGFLFAGERVLPMDRVRRIDGGVVYTDLTEQAFEALERFVEHRYGKPDPNTQTEVPVGYNQNEYLMDVVVAEGSAAGLGTEVPPERAVPPPTGPEDVDQPTLAPGLRVVDVNGEKVGEVHELSVAPDTGKPTRLTVRRGLIFRSETEIPPDWIQEYSDDGVVLNVAKDQVERLANQ
jgi:nucleotide-binding universal stress UspA family protein/uncharacterized protein YrrD